MRRDGETRSTEDLTRDAIHRDEASASQGTHRERYVAVPPWRSPFSSAFASHPSTTYRVAMVFQADSALITMVPSGGTP